MRPRGTTAFQTLARRPLRVRSCTGLCSCATDAGDDVRDRDSAPAAVRATSAGALPIHSVAGRDLDTRLSSEASERLRIMVPWGYDADESAKCVVVGGESSPGVCAGDWFGVRGIGVVASGDGVTGSCAGGSGSRTVLKTPWSNCS